MLDAIVRELGIARSESWMVGDSEMDVQAGASAGMRTGLVFPSNRCELCPLREGVSRLGKRAVPDVHAATLDKVAALILAS
jgi:histidinol phosphatase-like enzyme